jgi:hypothetical protein
MTRAKTMIAALVQLGDFLRAMCRLRRHQSWLNCAGVLR